MTGLRGNSVGYWGWSSLDRPWQSWKSFSRLTNCPKPHLHYYTAYIVCSLSHADLHWCVWIYLVPESPLHEKGLLIGTLYAIKGLYQVLAAVLSLPYYLVPEFPVPSCGVYFYLVNGVLGVVAVLVYMCVSRRYRYRERDDLCNVYQYAEQYYSNQQQRRNHEEQDWGPSSIVHTIALIVFALFSHM